jgi:hypothetical protein
MHPDKIKQGLIETEKYFMNKLGKYRGSVSLIMGLPFETKETALASLEWLEKNWNRQSVLAYPLNINLTGNKSKIDNDYEKYGYRILKNEKKDDIFERHNIFSDDTVIWENDNMNYFDALELVNKQLGVRTGEEINCPYLGKWRVDSWTLWSLMGLQKDMNIDIQTILDIREIVFPDVKNIIDNPDAVVREAISLKAKMKNRSRQIRKNYIQKKLSL